MNSSITRRYALTTDNKDKKLEDIQRLARTVMRPQSPVLIVDARNRGTGWYELEVALDRRLEAISKGLERRLGRWRFAAIARLPEQVHVDEVSGAEVKGGLLLRDTKTAEPLAVSYVTATEMKRRRRLTFYDKR